ncbi:MAG TPA: hypothetical protein VHI93_06270, partial [Candidatus Thermoplasmatota archaeon]|nr:hypothetical protein [Candidatus Thermoplasmatota archaeon]
QLEQEAREAGRQRARLEAEAAAAQRLLRSARQRSGGAAAALAIGALAWLAAGWRTPLGLAMLSAALAVAFFLALGVSLARQGGEAEAKSGVRKSRAEGTR